MSNVNPLSAPDADVLAIAAAAASDIARLTGVERHDIAVTLGSGWGRAAELIGETVAEVPATEITGFSRPEAEGHVGTLRSVVTPRGKHVLVIGARTHYYEGKAVRFVVHSVRAAAATGAKVLVLTNGAGSVRTTWAPGQPVLISDHINLTGSSPAVGAKFIDLTDLYSLRLRDVAHSVDPSLPEGVYVQFPGPHYETPAEVRYAKVIGGDLVGMSTALEAIAARQAGLEVLGISLVTNLAAGVKTTPLSHQEVLDAGREAEPRIGALLARVIGAL
ncbi:MAG: purine-nucleoside phosphorylase [Microbacterium sp.]